MATVVQGPQEFWEGMANLRFPPPINQRMQELMDRNNDGRLNEPERKELESLVELSESMSLVRAKVLILLGRKPS